MTGGRIRTNRRAFLRAAGTVAVGLPFLEGLPERSAWAATENPVFGLFICTSCGVVQGERGDPERFWPTSEGALTRESMEASAAERSTGILAEYADKLLMVRGVNYPHRSNGCGHAIGLAQALTAAQWTGSNNNVISSGISADTLIAQELNPAGVEPLTLYAGLKGGYIDEKLSFSAPGQVRSAEGNPWNVYQRLVGLIPEDGGSGGNPGMADQIALKRKSVNDLVLEELNALLGRPDLSQADRQRLERHFEGIRETEQGMTDLGLSCSAAGLDVSALEAMNSGNAFRRDGNQEEVVKLHADLVALTFACNLNRVATLQAGDGTDGTRYVIDGQTFERFHHISHRINGDGSSGDPIPNAVDKHVVIDRLRMETFKYLLDRWSEYSTAAGSLLDNAFVYWTSHVANGPSHSFSNLPVIIAGSAGGFLKQGQYVDARGVTSNRLLNTLITANGVRRNGSPVEDFGSGGLTGGLISEMLA